MTPTDEMVEAVARAIYEAECATDPLDPERQPDWGRGGFKTAILAYQAMAQAAIAALTPFHEADRAAAVLAAAREKGRLEGLEQAMAALQADAVLCNCFAHDESECTCGAWDDYKTITSSRAVEIIAQAIRERGDD